MRRLLVILSLVLAVSAQSEVLTHSQVITVGGHESATAVRRVKAQVRFSEIRVSALVDGIKLQTTGMFNTGAYGAAAWTRYPDAKLAASDTTGWYFLQSTTYANWNYIASPGDSIILKGTTNDAKTLVTVEYR